MNKMTESKIEWYSISDSKELLTGTCAFIVWNYRSIAAAYYSCERFLIIKNMELGRNQSRANLNL